MADPRDRLSPKEAAAWMRVSRPSFMRYVAPHIKSVRVGCRLFYLRADLEAWVDSQRASESTAPSAAWTKKREDAMNNDQIYSRQLATIHDFYKVPEDAITAVENAVGKIMTNPHSEHVDNLGAAERSAREAAMKLEKFAEQLQKERVYAVVAIEAGLHVQDDL